MFSLDDAKIARKYDTSDVLGLIESFPEQCRGAKDIGDSFKLPGAFKTGYANAVITGLGGSAIGGDILRSYTAHEIKIPVSVNRNYALPAFVGSSSLVIASSYSGDTEETISAYKDAIAKKSRVIVITSGGRLKEMAVKDKVPCLVIPKGFPPRCALGYSFFPLLILFSKLGLIGDKSGSIDEAIKTMKELKKNSIGQKVPNKDNSAKNIASRIFGKFPVIYSAQDHFDSVATRWRNQIEENAKTVASTNFFPEMNHNEVMGWDNPKKVVSELIALVLRDSLDHPRIAKRMDITKTMIESGGNEVIEVHSSKGDLLSRIFSLIYTGDFVSYYLAILNKVDPMSIDRITYLKKELAKS